MNDVCLIQEHRLEQQDLISDIRAGVVANIGKERAQNAQIALSRFAALVDQLTPGDIEKVGTQLGSVLPALTADKPNIDFAERAIVNIGNTLLKARGGVPGLFYKATNGSPIVSVYFALVCSLLSFLVLFGIYYFLDSRDMLPEFFWFAGKEFLLTVSFAFLGAMVSIAFRLDGSD